MRSSIQACKNCNTFTLLESCSQCNTKTSNPLPPRFSPEDKYGKYRRMLKERTD